MATVAHIIRSHYDPADREQLERATGQRDDDDDDPPDPWHTESAFSAQRRVRAAPTFVPATLSYDEWGVPLRTATSSPVAKTHPPSSTSTAAWYRALTAAAASSTRTDAPPPVRPSSAPTHSSRPIPAPAPPPAPSAPRPQPRPNWFAHTPPTAPTPAPPPTLADILARDPPPLPSEGRFAPPVWLHIGPSNRGFGMLQRRGWREGEGLGAHVARRPATASARGVADTGGAGAPEIVDLTLSDSGSDSDSDSNSNSNPELELEVEVPGRGEEVLEETADNRVGATEADASHMPRSLLTPLPTVLKADRLGIGLKAKTEGPYRQSKKRVTHSAAALAAHIKAAEEMRRHKATVGRGKRGFAKIHKKEEDRRKAMLAYLNE